MAVVPNTLTLNLAKSLSVAIGLFGFAFTAWIFYSTLVLYPNDASFSVLGAILSVILVTLGVSSAVLGRLVRRRISGQTFSTGAIYGLAVGIAILWLPLFLPSPSMVVFFLISGSLLLLHALFGRQKIELSTRLADR
ncbi:MAG: hypothetical protein HQ477_12165 [Chloroflexi bacterium]|jgi:hypothetical protein|nr:hypothetical protein [Chloroflexota bacterium]